MGRSRRLESDQAQEYEEHSAQQARRDDGVAVRPPPKPDQDLGNAPLVSTGETVTVACKLPMGLVLRLFEPKEVKEVTPAGQRTVTQYFAVPGEEIKLNGFANPVGGAVRNVTYGRYGITRGVLKEFWEAWLAINKESDLVRNQLIFAFDDHETALYAAEDHAETRSGLEPLDPKAKLRVGKMIVEEATRENPR